MPELLTSEIRGFNYHGSWGTSGLDLWQHHDNGTMAVEIARGKKYFPAWNAARWWLSNEAFQRSPDRFLANFEAGLEIFARLNIKVMPVLFNRWRDPVCDYGGVALEHIVPGLSIFCGDGDFQSETPTTGPSQQASSFLGKTLEQHGARALFAEYLEAVIGTHNADERIFAWDLCNEPFLAPYVADPDSPIRAAELRWLAWCGDRCRKSGAKQPITVGNANSVEITEPIVDIISFHPYYVPPDLIDPVENASARKSEYEYWLDKVVEFAHQRGKDLLASEAVWGAKDDAERVSTLRYTLGELVKRRIGFMAEGLHHSLVADYHAPEYGPLGLPGRMEFINADGTLRSGHDAYNEFAGHERA